MIEVDSLVRTLGDAHVLDGLSFVASPGSVTGFLGPNGAGKTTTLRMLTTLLAPTSGTAVVAGSDVQEAPDEVRRRIGYVGQGNAAAHAQRAGDELYSQGLIHGMDRRQARARAAELLESLGLAELERRKVSDLSGGQRRRLDVAMGLVHAPGLLFLDEPTSGLDPHNRVNLWEHIMRMRAESGMTIVLTTHYLDEADSFAERVVVVDHGEVIADDTADALKAGLAGDRLVLEAADPAAAARLAGITARAVGVRAVSAEGVRVEARVLDGPRVLPEILVAAWDADARAVSAVLQRPTLDDVFLSLTGRSLREAGTGATVPASPKDAA